MKNKKYKIRKLKLHQVFCVFCLLLLIAIVKVRTFLDFFPKIRKKIFTEKIFVSFSGTLKKVFPILFVFLWKDALNFLLKFSIFVLRSESEKKRFFCWLRIWKEVFCLGSHGGFQLVFWPVSRGGERGPPRGSPPSLRPSFVPLWNFAEMARRDRGRTPTVPCLSSTLPSGGGD